jgi:hypothetical protein
MSSPSAAKTKNVSVKSLSADQCGSNISVRNATHTESLGGKAKSQYCG